MALVQGDTTTAMAAAITCHYARVPVGHVEAGLRTGDLSEPFPEEANRKIISAIADLHFAPTEHARAALVREGISDGRVYVTGNTVVDSLHCLAARIPRTLQGRERLLLVTAHRRESFGRPLAEMCRALRTLVRAYPDVRIVYPVHPNPRVRAPVEAALGHEPRIELVPPMDYLQFLGLLERSYLVLTDSGGVQEEAPVFGKPVLVLRRQSERMEAVEAGCALLVGTAHDDIVAAARRLLDDPHAYAAMSRAVSPFGDGHAAPRIVRILEQFSPALPLVQKKRAEPDLPVPAIL
jgi:UDP-N-acetylglucosamine 2-epimerase (non-hydrolysing)